MFHESPLLYGFIYGHNQAIPTLDFWGSERGFGECNRCDGGVEEN